MDLAKIIEKERKRLRNKYDYHRANHRDTGNNRNYNLMNRYEDELIELDHLQTRINQMESQEYRFNSLLNDLSAKATNLRLDYPHEDALLLFEIYFRERREQWGRMAQR